MENKLKSRQTLTIGLMLFALFLGAGNMIFPPLLGQQAGENLWSAITGFLITGVGLPLLGVASIAITGGSLYDLSSRVHPLFAGIFTAVLYLAIGPFFGIPRTGTVAFEIGVTPFLPESINANTLPLMLYTIVFFGITLWLSINPTKLVDRVGKILTPILIAVLGIIIIAGVSNPIGSASNPTEAYSEGPLFEGFIKGYLTMDAIASLVFGMVVVNAVKEKGVKSRKALASSVIKAGVIAATGLALIYLSLAYLGATSFKVIGPVENGGIILSGLADYLFGSTGALLLGLAITFACLTTSVGLVTACGEYFSAAFPRLSYKLVVTIVTIFSALIANVGLTQLIGLTLPVLIAIYPIAIVLIVLSFMNDLFNGYSYVYRGAIIGAMLISIPDAILSTGIELEAISSSLELLPLYEKGIGWLVPAVLGGLIGYLMAKKREDVNGHAMNKA
ncbi:branched-chain amino acid transport system II carrier protein [Pseudalkalibacillus caeni]|uniref:Branched-chain amino acid transport system carrier protein n=1 Tax=Exobacillus caeni TaxID=2574798 RepID=A0A5R9F6A7_9BACL|nr:branched-chain amino acid transport system II carrier protein [Pseudalkalibacillus caeni]TLS39097.1 branched-chain amino acid transport system II carrier protein [Pseudalkalibacillus caeni]